MIFFSSLSPCFNFEDFDFNRLSDKIVNPGPVQIPFTKVVPFLSITKASVSGVMLDCIGSTSHFIPVEHLHGTSDNVMPYNGGIGWNFVQKALDHWINFNNTTSNPTVSIDDSEGITIEHYVYDEGNNSGSVENYKYIVGNHVWFSSTFRGRNTSELIWNFMSRYDINGLI